MNNLFKNDGTSTEINPNAIPVSQAVVYGESGTIVNPNAGVVPEYAGTVVNPNAAPIQYSTHNISGANLGVTVGGKYTLVSQIPTNSGEADIYICADAAGMKYCLKHYKRLDVNKEVRERLQDFHAPFVAELIEWGYWNNIIYEVWPVYSNGSLAGKRFNEEKAKRYIAQMHSAIRAVHNCGIVHQDIKPANFMLDENENVILIDFGVSSIAGTADKRTHVTRLGLTTDYAAPEVLLSEFCWPSSDYYSLGISIYEMLLGVTPYHSYDKNMYQRKIDDMRDGIIPNIETLSEEMQHLLTGLLQYDKAKRWSAEGVIAWLNGKYDDFIIPAAHGRRGAAAGHKNDTSFVPTEKKFKFDGSLYSIPSQLPELVTHMAYRWDSGQNLFGPDGRFERLKETLKDIEGTEDIYAICNAPKQKGEDESLNYFRKLYQLYPGLKLFAWKQYRYENKAKLGEAILNTLWAKEIEEDTTSTSEESPSASSIFRVKSPQNISSNDSSASYPSYIELLFWMRNGVISRYLSFTGDDNLADTVSEIEATAENNPAGCYTIAYMLSKSTKLRLPSGTFSDKEAFLRFVSGKIEESEKSGDVSVFLNFCRSEIYDGKNINNGFQAWITSLGLGDTLSILTDSRFAEEVYGAGKGSH